MVMSDERKQKCGEALIEVFNGMHTALEVLLEEAEERSLVYDVHGSQLADVPGSVENMWKMRVMCCDGYARTFEEQRKTLEFLGEQIAREDREWVESTRLDGKGSEDWA